MNKIESDVSSENKEENSVREFNIRVKDNSNLKNEFTNEKCD